MNVQGYVLKIGDTVKFGRVRFKVILMHRGERDFENGEQVYKEMRFKSAPAKKTNQKEMSIIRNTLGHEDDEESQEVEDCEDEEQFEDVRIEEGESFSERIPHSII